MTGGTQVAQAEKPTWLALLQDGRAAYTVLLNLGVALHAINIYVISTVMPSVVADIGGLTLYAWPSMLYMVGTLVGAASGGPVRLTLGRRRAYVAAGTVFGAGCVGCAAAPGMGALLLGQLVQGFGGGLLLALSMALVSNFYAGGLRGRILSLISTTWGVAALFGPLLGGGFAALAWWRGAYWAEVPIIAAFVLAAWRVIPNGGESTERPTWPIGRLGLLGLGVLAVGASGQLPALWHKVPLFLAAGVCVWLAFRIDERARDRLFPSRALSFNSPVGANYWLFLFMSVAYTAMMMYIPLLLQVVHGISPLWVGYASAVFSIAWMIGSLAVGGLSGGMARVSIVTGMIVTALGLAGLAIPATGTTIWFQAACITVIGLGVGMSSVLATNFGMSVAAKGEETITASAMPAIRSIGIAFGAAAAGVVANAAGLSQGAAPDIVAHAVTWVLGLDVAMPLLAALCALRMFQLDPRRNSIGESRAH